MPKFIPHDVAREDRGDGSILLRSRVPLDPVARNTGEWVDEWAAKAPDRVFIAERAGDGWRELTYAETRRRVRAVAASLLARGLDQTTPILVISGNSVDHGILALGAQYVGVPVVPVAEQYSLIAEARPRLQYVAEAVKPSLVFADDTLAYGAALALDCLRGVEKIVSRRDGAHANCESFDRLIEGRDGPEVDAAHAKVGPETLAKIIFTSGSTSTPKGVLTTHGMLCVNQAQMTSVNPFITARPPKILDWLPWNHVFGGSHNFYMILSNGGSLYIDDGKPTKSGFAATLRNIREHQGNLAFNVPIGFAQLVAAMRTDQELKRAYFRDLDVIFYAAAAVPQDIWDALAGFAKEVRDELPLMLSGWGMSETAPAVLQAHEPVGKPGAIGVPLPATTVKLLPNEASRYEIRVAGPNVTKGYFDEPEKTAAAFDPEGFLITGDAVKFIDPDNPNSGLAFDGRISDDFKLLSGTWVRAANVRLEALKHLADLASDIVITGHNRNELGVLIFPDPQFIKARALEAVELTGALASEGLKALLCERLQEMAQQMNSSSTRIVRAIVLAAPASMSDGELTAKGSLNSRKVLDLRRALVERLYSGDDPAVAKLA